LSKDVFKYSTTFKAVKKYANLEEMPHYPTKTGNLIRSSYQLDRREEALARHGMARQHL